MHTLRPSNERGSFDFGWLKTNHTFSFADYRDPNHMGFRSLRVINEDFIAPAKGFGTHGHNDMEIVTYVIRGSLSHKDSMGNGSSIHPGDVQYMSAGTGVTHSEFCESKTEETHLLQIWILPNQKGYTPRYDQKQFLRDQKLNQLCLLVGDDGSGAPIEVHQDLKLFASILQQNQNISYSLQSDRHAWLQLIRGQLSVGSSTLSAGDGLAISEESNLAIQATHDEAEFLLFDLA